MTQPGSQPSVTQPLFGVPLVALPPALGLLGLGGVACSGNAETLPTYVWPDVAIAYGLSAVPLAVALHGWVTEKEMLAGSTVLGAIGVSLSAALTSLRPLESGLLRVAAALGLALGAVWFFSAMLGRVPWTQSHRSPSHWPALMLVGVLLMWLVPATYVQARCRHDADRLQDLLEQSRLGEARMLALRVLALDGSAHVQNRPLGPVAADLARTVAYLESRVAQPLSAGASDEQWLQRVRELAIVGDHDAALGLMAASSRRARLPQACNLRGTILETLGQWQAAGQAYRSAKSAWQDRLDWPDQTEECRAGLIRAATGIGYSERKLGHHRNAEAAYLERLTLAPTADSHFLLAQFYEHAQQIGSARRHARRAMTLDPQQYRTQGELLLNKLATFHFGCFW